MEILKELEKEGLSTLIEKYSLEAKEHEDGRVILNYSQINSPKHNKTVGECRGLVLANNSLVARSFPRFFNLGEVPDNGDMVDWSNCIIQEKVDGSLILVYFWNSSWHVNTRGSFGNGETNGRTWRSLVEECVDFSSLDPALTYVFELCSPYNQVVRFYSEPGLFLLTAFRGEQEVSWGELSLIDVKGKVGRPQVYKMASSSEILSFLEQQEEDDKTFEGVVVRDSRNFRLKIKSKSYLRIHRLSNNGSVINPKNIVPIILRGEQEEIGAYWPALMPRIKEVEGLLEENFRRLDSFYFVWKDEPSQKKFAAELLTFCPTLAPIAFKARKSGKDLKEVWVDSEDFLARTLFGTF